MVVGEADPSGATIVAAVGDKDGLQAAALVDTDYFNTLLVADFANRDAANAAYMTLINAELEGALEANHSGIIALVHAVDVDKVKQQIPEATKVTTAEVDEATAKDITETAKAADTAE